MELITIVAMGIIDFGYFFHINCTRGLCIGEFGLQYADALALLLLLVNG
jgi:hypothetical protein